MCYNKEKMKTSTQNAGRRELLPGMKTWIDNTSDKWYYLDVQEATNSHSYTVKGSETWTALTSDPNWSLYE